jgi:UDP-N-acetylglucosamine:LPS N-acetylglucosamine transferase
MKIAIVSSCGGHLTEVRALSPAYRPFDHFYVINDRIPLSADMRSRTYFISHSERDWRTLLNLVEAFRILRKERPDVILSTGAGPVVPFALLGRFLFGTRVIFVETMTRIHRPSLTGRVMYHLAHHFFYQWVELARFFPRGVFSGTII